MMHARLVFLCIILASCYAVFALQTGIKATFTQKGINYMKDVGIKAMLQQLEVIDIPAISGVAGTPIGKIEYTLQNIKLKDIQIPSANIEISAGYGLTVSVNNFIAAIALDWRYRESAWPHISDHGTADAKVENMNMAFLLKFGRDDNGRPTISTDSITLTIGNINVKLHGGASWLYDLFLKLFNKRIHDAVVSALESNVMDAININAAAVLSTIPVVEKIGNISMIDISLTTAPTFGTSTMTTSHMGQFYLQKSPEEAPFTAAPMPDVTGEDHMLELFVSDYVLNTAGWVYAESGDVHMTITADEFPSSLPFQLNTTSLKLFLPTLYAKYPDRLLQLDVRLTKAPTFGFNSTVGAAGIMFADIVVNVVVDTGLVEAFTLQTEIDVTCVLKITSDNRLTGTLGFLNVTLTVTNSSIGPVSVQVIQNLMNLLMKTVILPKINSYLATGFPLPIVYGLQLVDPKISFGADYMVIGTDICYDPSMADSGVYIPVDQLLN